jgi:hypothetical protein
VRRVCFLGNSHLAALKLALDEARAAGLLDGIATDTFGSHRATLATCTIADGTLTPTAEAVAKALNWTSGGKDRVVIDAYDDIFVVAGRSPYSLVNYLPPGALPPPSRSLYQEVAAAVLSGWAPSLARQLAAAGSARVHFVGEPELSDAAPFARGLLARAEGMPGQRAALATRLREIREEIAGAVASVPHGLASVIDFPPATLDGFGAFTRHEFCRGSMRLTENLAEAHPPDDFAHMNGAFGRELLRHIGLLAPVGTGPDAG